MVKKVTSSKYGFQYLYVLMMISLTFQLSNYLPLLQYHYIFWSIGILFAFVYSYNYLLRTVSFFAYFYLILVCLNCYFGDGYFKTYINCFTEAFSLLVPITMLYYIFSKNEKSLFKWILIAFGLFMIESTIVSLIANAINPGLVRLQSNEETNAANAFMLLPFKRIGLTSYTLPHALPIIIPAFVCMAKKCNDSIRKYMSIFTIFAILLIYASGSFTALVLGTLALIYSIMANKNGKKSSNVSFFIISVILLPLLLDTELQLSIIKYIQGFVDRDSIFALKLMDIERALRFDDAAGAVGGRNDLYMITIEEFLKNTMMGSNNELGGHCALIDRLATLGIIGFIPLILFIYKQVRYTLNYIKSSMRTYYYQGLFVGLLMMSVKGFAGWEMWFCLLVMLPGILWYTDVRKA